MSVNILNSSTMFCNHNQVWINSEPDLRCRPHKTCDEIVFDNSIMYISNYENVFFLNSSNPVLIEDSIANGICSSNQSRTFQKVCLNSSWIGADNCDHSSSSNEQYSGHVSSITVIITVLIGVTVICLTIIAGFVLYNRRTQQVLVEISTLELDQRYATVGPKSGIAGSFIDITLDNSVYEEVYDDIDDNYADTINNL